MLLRSNTADPAEAGAYFLRPTTRLPTIPPWAKAIRFLDEDFQNALQESSGAESARGLCERLSECGVKVQEFGLDAVARELIRELNSLSLPSDEEAAYWGQMLRWLFRAAGPSPSSLEQLPVKLPTRGHGLRRATECYLSEPYPGGWLAWRLLGGIEAIAFVADREQLGLADAEPTEVERFLRALGVQVRPKKVSISTMAPVYRKFLGHVIDAFPFPINIRGQECDDLDDVRRLSRAGIRGLKLPEHFAEILSTADAAAIIEYLQTDETLLAQTAEEGCIFTATIGSECHPQHPRSSPDAHTGASQKGRFSD